MQEAAVVVRGAVCVVMLVCGAVLPATGQGRDGGDRSGRSSSALALERLARSAAVWDANNDQIYTCAEWKKFVTDLFNQADRNHDGFVDAQEFKSIQDATPQFKDSSLGYFDDNGDGRLSRAEFVDKPNPFFLQFDKNRDCKVTIEEIMDASRPAYAPPTPQSSGPSLR